MKRVRVREAKHADREAIESLVQLGARDARKRIGPHPAPVKMEDLQVRGCLALVAEVDGKVIGSVAYRVRGGRLHFFNLVVDGMHRNNGIAHALLRELERIAVRSGARHMTLQTIEELGVLPVFTYAGFRVQSVKREFLLSPERDRALTTVYMIKRLEWTAGNSAGKW